MAPEQRAELFQRVDNLTKAPMLLLALAMIPLLAGPEIFELPAQTVELIEQLDLFIWAAFALELTLKTYLAPSRLNYLRENWIDVIIVAIPVFRPLRFLRFLRLGVFLARFSIGIHRLFTQHGLGYALMIGLGLVVIAAFLMTKAESGAGGTISDFADALWWALTTVTTVGYGDKFPVTAEGRAIAVFLMVVGITLFGVITANLAAFFVDKEQDTSLHEKLDDIVARLERLESNQQVKE